MKNPMGAPSAVVGRRSQLTTSDAAADTATCACRMQRHFAKGNAHLRSHRGDLHAQSGKPQKASQTHIAVASRTPLSRRRPNPRAIASLPEYVRLRDSWGEI